MNLLLDTHVLLWWLDDPTLLSEQALTSIKDTNNEVIVSVVSAWEIAIKKTLGKLEAPDNLKQMIGDAGFTLIPINYKHVWEVQDLPFHHDDPFDRLLVAKTKVENLMLVTRDSRLRAYNIPILDA
ncbi:MAG: type II toxin-antitoxin system VapC family toxin [Candidatus Poribacteria bacterium]|nr:type II toxin-antitoxin system VapC family toxin [Candidatus Poribacteria bacterium]